METDTGPDERQRRERRDEDEQVELRGERHEKQDEERDVGDRRERRDEDNKCFCLFVREHEEHTKQIRCGEREAIQE